MLFSIKQQNFNLLANLFYGTCEKKNRHEQSQPGGCCDWSSKREPDSLARSNPSKPASADKALCCRVWKIAQGYCDCRAWVSFGTTREVAPTIHYFIKCIFGVLLKCIKHTKTRSVSLSLPCSVIICQQDRCWRPVCLDGCHTYLAGCRKRVAWGRGGIDSPVLLRMRWHFLVITVWLISKWDGFGIGYCWQCIFQQKYISINVGLLIGNQITKKLAVPLFSKPPHTWGVGNNGTASRLKGLQWVIGENGKDRTLRVFSCRCRF